jgi:hypothetical protein
MYSVYTLMNRYVEREKVQESYVPFPLFAFYWQEKIPRRVYLLYYALAETVHQHLDTILFFLLFGNESMLTRYSNKSFLFRVLACHFPPWVVCPEE